MSTVKRSRSTKREVFDQMQFGQKQSQQSFVGIGASHSIPPEMRQTCTQSICRPCRDCWLGNSLTRINRRVAFLWLQGGG